MAQHTHHVGLDLEPEDAIAQLRKRRAAMLAIVVATMVAALVLGFIAIYAAYNGGGNAGMY